MRLYACAVPFVILAVIGFGLLDGASASTAVACSDLWAGQYTCEVAPIDPTTQSQRGCQPDDTVMVPCTTVPGVRCVNATTNNTSAGSTFARQVPCRYTAGTRFDVALCLSVFGGFLGLDRFYLGYPFLALFKLSTMGFFTLFWLYDIIFIASQALEPADGSHYVVPYYSIQHHVTANSETIVV